jgi:Homing endonuclease associated repeat
MPRIYVKEYTPDQLLRILKRVAKRNGGRPLSWRQYDRLRDRSDPSGNTFRQPHYFGTWRNALRAANLPLTPPLRADIEPSSSYRR